MKMLRRRKGKRRKKEWMSPVSKFKWDICTDFQFTLLKLVRFNWKSGYENIIICFDRELFITRFLLLLVLLLSLMLFLLLKSFYSACLCFFQIFLQSWILCIFSYVRNLKISSFFFFFLLHTFSVKVLKLSVVYLLFALPLLLVNWAFILPVIWCAWLSELFAVCFPLFLFIICAVHLCCHAFYLPRCPPKFGDFFCVCIYIYIWVFIWSSWPQYFVYKYTLSGRMICVHSTL